MKKIVVSISILLLFAGCTAKTNLASPEISSAVSPSSIEPTSSSSEESAPAESQEIVSADHQTTEKYYDYFMEHSYVSMLLGNETGGDGFSDNEMSAYALCELIQHNDGSYDQMEGFPQKDMDAVCEKVFGAVPESYENRMTTILAETGNITSTGWGGSAVDFILKELETGPDGILTGVFYQFNFGMDSMGPDVKADLLQGRFENYGQPYLVTMVFEEKTDEEGEMFLRFHRMKSNGEAKPPYQPYTG